MTVKIRYLNRRGDEGHEVSLEEAQQIVSQEQGRYICFNEATHKMMGKFEIAEGQALVLIPVIRGG